MLRIIELADSHNCTVLMGIFRLTDRTITVYGILLYGAILFVNYGMNHLDEYPGAKLENEIYLDFKLLALQKIGRMGYSEYQKLGTGKLVQQIENGANAGKGVLYDFWFCVVRNLLPTILFSLFFIWKIDRNITYFLMAGYIIVFLATNLLLKGLYQIKEKILTNEEELNHFLVRGFMEMPVFRMKHQFPNEIKKASGTKRIIVASKVKMTMIHEAFFAVFDGTVRENLVFDKEAADDDLYVSLENTQLLSMLASLDQGVDTRIGEKGTCLSGGEKQRLALARLWFDDSEIVVLDEATSALDNVTESIVMKNVLRRVNHATVIAIAHRLASISGFDRIVVFRDGKIVGNGTFEELLANNSYFHELYRKEKGRQ